MMIFHGELAVALGVAVHVRFLNAPRVGPAHLLVRAAEDVAALRASLASGPSGGTPLCSHVRQIVNEIKLEEQRLRTSGKVRGAAFRTLRARTDCSPFPPHPPNLAPDPPARPPLSAAQQAVLTIVTDGQPTDGDLARAMQPLSELPVWLVVRLCTDEADVVAYWSNLDSIVRTPAVRARVGVVAASTSPVHARQPAHPSPLPHHPASAFFLFF